MPEMSISMEWYDLVDEHGRLVEAQINEGNTDNVNWLMTDYVAFGPSDRPTLTESEECALEHIKDTFDIEVGLRRPIYGVDFVYGNIGFEVKRDENEELSERQKDHAEIMEAVFVVISDGEYAGIDRVIR